MEYNKDKKTKRSHRVRQSLLIKFLLVLSLIFFGYIGLKYWNSKALQRSKAAAEIKKFDNIDSEIFNLSGENLEQESDESDEKFPVTNADEIRERGPDFVYRMLLKNQDHISNLQVQIQALRDDLIKYKNQEKIGRMIFTYVDLRQQILASKPYEESLKNLEILTSSDSVLSKKLSRLRIVLPKLLSEESLDKAFASIIPDIIVTKNHKPDSGILSKIRRNISKLVVIRRIDENGGDPVDAIVAKIERLLRDKQYKDALATCLTLGEEYHEITKGFLENLNVAIEVSDIDHEIFNYLKSLS